MKIAIDGRCVSDRFPGIGRYTFDLCRALSAVVCRRHHEIVFLYDPRARNSRFPLSFLASMPNVTLRSIKAGVFSPYAQFAVPYALRQDRIDVYHSPYYVRPYFALPPTIVTLHDTIPLSFSKNRTQNKDAFLFSLTTRLTLAMASRVIIGSRASQRDFARLFGVPECKSTVVYHAVNEQFHPQTNDVQRQLTEELGLPAEFILYVGTNRPHKNLSTLVRALGRMTDSSIHLIIAGYEDPRYREVRDLVDMMALRERVRFLGAVDEAKLPVLYSTATVFAFPSLWEGFGLPILEAMACGTPVISSASSCLPEVAGDAAVFVDPCDVDGWATALDRLLSDRLLRSTLRERGQARSAEFSWEKTAQATLDVYEKAVVG